MDQNNPYIFHLIQRLLARDRVDKIADADIEMLEVFGFVDYVEDEPYASSKGAKHYRAAPDVLAKNRTSSGYRLVHYWVKGDWTHCATATQAASLFKIGTWEEAQVSASAVGALSDLKYYRGRAAATVAACDQAEKWNAYTVKPVEENL